MADKDLRKSVHVNEISEAAVAGVQGREFYHDPVMLQECLEGLNIKADGRERSMRLTVMTKPFSLQRSALQAFSPSLLSIRFRLLNSETKLNRILLTVSFMISASAAIRWMTLAVVSRLLATIRSICVWTVAKMFLLRNGSAR